MPGGSEAGYLSSTADASLDNNSDYSVEQEPKHRTEDYEEIDSNHSQVAQHQADTDQKADPGSKVDTVQDDDPELFGLHHALGLGQRSVS
ncbi:MAG TPA: hypothetical protein VJ301_16435 [Propionibacteriaceae bacterium]|nr:hypothetical protein [Propionibacteriaceae bacterium]